LRYNNQPDPTAIKKLDSLAELLRKQDYEKLSPVYFAFNPNYVTVDSLLMLGFPRKVAERLYNYREKGGRFDVKKDMKKIYGLSDSLMNRIYPYIDLPEKSKAIISPMDINTINSRELASRSGIDGNLASRIVNYRFKLGGFVLLDQLIEVYGITDDLAKQLKSKVFIVGGYRPRLIKINHENAQKLQQHPYISDQLAEDIIRYREINGTIKSQTVLADFKSMDMVNFEKLIFYLDFN
jgi:DNA uptake protein ComE-like DNA-binding protein